MAGFTSRVPEAAEAEGAPSAHTPPFPMQSKGRIRRAFDKAWSWCVTLMLWFSAIGTVLMLAYQYLYPWGYRLPWQWSEPGLAWIGAFIMLFVYIGSKIPHLWGQEPGDTVGLIREVLLGLVNVLMVVWFLAAVRYGGVEIYPENALGIAIMHLAGFIGLIIWQINTAMRLSKRTWSDLSGAGV